MLPTGMEEVAPEHTTAFLSEMVSARFAGKSPSAHLCYWAIAAFRLRRDMRLRRDGYTFHRKPLAASAAYGGEAALSPCGDSRPRLSSRAQPGSNGNLHS